MINKKINIINCASYILDKCKNEKQDIIELKLQKMLYFIEAFYTADNNVDNLYDDDWLVKPNGPMSLKIHELFKNKGLPIDMNKVNFTLKNKVPEKIRKYIDKIYNVFGKLSTSDLVVLTQMKDSPWSEIFINNLDLDLFANNDVFVDKIKTREWFKKRFKFMLRKEK